MAPHLNNSQDRWATLWPLLGVAWATPHELISWHPDMCGPAVAAVYAVLLKGCRKRMGPERLHCHALYSALLHVETSIGVPALLLLLLLLLS